MDKMDEDKRAERVGQEDISRSDDLRALQTQVVQGVLRALAIIGPFAAAAGSYYEYVNQRISIIPLYWGVYACILLVALWKRVAYKLRAWTVVVIFYGLAVLDFISDGRGGSGRLFLLIVPFAAALFLGLREGIASVVLSLLTIAAFGWAYVTGRLTVPKLDSAAPVGWVSNSAVYIMLATFVVVSLNYLIPRLIAALRRSRKLARELEEERAGLEEQVEERTADLARRSNQLEAAARVARDAAGIRDVERLLDKTVSLISERFGFYHAGIFLLDGSGEYALLQAASSEGGQRMLEREHRLKVGEQGIVGYVAQEAEPRIALDVGEDAVYFDNPDLPLTRSEMALPLEVKGQLIGVLDVQSTEARAFSDEDVSILQTMADQVALAIQNARLLEEAEERVEKAQALLRRETREGWEELIAERPRWGYAYDGAEVLEMEDRGAEMDEESQLALPLRVRGEAIGKLNLKLDKQSPTPEEEALFRAVADEASQALESARLFQETQRALGESETLYRASEAIVAAGTPGEILRALTDYVLPPQVDRCVLALLSPTSASEEPVVEIEAAWEPGIEEPDVLGNRWNVSQIPIIAQMFTEPLAISDVATSPELDEVSRRVFQNVLNIDALAIVPLIAGERILGWLLVESLRGPYEFGEREMRLYRALADQMAMALEELRLLEETERRAERERLAAGITSRVRSSTDVDTILRTAIGELGRVLKASEGVIRLKRGDGVEDEEVTERDGADG